MNPRTVLVPLALLAVCAAAVSQPPTIPPPAQALPTAPSVTVPTAPPPPPSVDQLLDALERLQVQKADLEKQEQALKAAIRKKLDEQDARLKKLGVAALAKESQPDRVGQIFIEGNTRTPNKKILDLVALQPGQVLKHPALEAARQNLEKAGFRGATVEVTPSEGDATFKDIRVKVTEPKPAPANDSR